jgi:hypothetical protein
MMEGPCADSEEKREPAGDIDTVVDGLKVLDPKRPIREADMVTAGVPEGDCLDFICTLTKGTPANF